jgi:hypothetical protein
MPQANSNADEWFILMKLIFLQQKTARVTCYLATND